MAKDIFAPVEAPTLSTKVTTRGGPDGGQAPAIQSVPGELEPMDELGEAIQKANALLCMTYGEAGECFRCMCDEYQDTYMWALSDLLHKAQRQLERLNSRAGEAQKD